MKTLQNPVLSLVLVACLVVLTWSPSAWAQVPDDNRYPDVGRVYVSLERFGETNQIQVAAQETFTFYLVLDAGEIPGVPPPVLCNVVSGQLRYPPELYLFSIHWMWDSTFDLGDGLSPGVLDFCIAGYGDGRGTWRISDGPTVIGSFEAVLLEDVQDGRVVVGPNNSGGLHDHFAYVAYNQWGQDDLECTPCSFEAPFDPTTGALKINSTNVATDGQSWGRVKALYRP